MKAYNFFIKELIKLKKLYISSVFAFEQTDEVLIYRQKNKLCTKDYLKDENELRILSLNKFIPREGFKELLSNDLRELIFIRIISALEVFLVDTVRDIFFITKEPFRISETVPKYNQAEILSADSMSMLYSKIINSESRKLTSGGFTEIVKYYKKRFDIDLISIPPGKQKMDQYHDVRHLLVHRLGKTDKQYKEKYKTADKQVSVSKKYLYRCISDFQDFAKKINESLVEKYGDQVKEIENIKCERATQIRIINKKNDDTEFLEPNFQFWVDDDIVHLNDILIEKRIIDDSQFELFLAGTNNQIDSYRKIMNTFVKKLNLYIEVVSDNIQKSKSNSEIEINEELIETVKYILPEQPWSKGIHKEIAAKLELPSTTIYHIIYLLIRRGEFFPQKNGKIIEPED